MSYHGTAKAQRNVLAEKRVRHALTEGTEAVNSTILPQKQLQAIADELGVSITITRTHVYEEYTSLVYEIDCLQNKIFNI